jgi:2-amino-4,5-dihydroxy-6-oxo-7-(phosphonooxy)heptanoate synthase
MANSIAGVNSSGKSVRLAKLSRHGDGRYLFVPLDHSVADGPIADADDFGDLVGDITTGGADAIVVHKGRARTIGPETLSDTSLVVHLSASTAHAADSNAKVLVCGVEEAIQLGADAVSLHVNVGSDTERQQLADFGAVAHECERWGIPLLAMVYPRGPRIDHPEDPKLLAHMVNIAADLGADLVKTIFAAPAHRMAEVVASSPIPVVVAGGAATPDHNVLDFASSALATGCSGLAVGRRVFAGPSPTQTVRRLSEIVHSPAEAKLRMAT